jgi:hypothetical protein
MIRNVLEQVRCIGISAARPKSPLLNRYEVVARIGVAIDRQSWFGIFIKS